MNRHDADPGRYELYLLDACALHRDGRPVSLKPREQRLVAALALQGRRPRSRGAVSGLLWPDVTEARAAGSLRSTVFGLRRAAPRLLLHDGGHLGLSSEIVVDVRRVSGLAERVIAQAADGGDPDRPPPTEALELLTTGELLPGWYEDWVLAERERLHQLRLAALESLAELLMDAGAVAGALTAGRAAIELDPLCESAQRTVIRIQLAKGNYHDAIQQYFQFRRRVLTELGIGPSTQMERLIRPLLDHGGRNRRATDPAPIRAAAR